MASFDKFLAERVEEVWDILVDGWEVMTDVNYRWKELVKRTDELKKLAEQVGGLSRDIREDYRDEIESDLSDGRLETVLLAVSSCLFLMDDFCEVGKERQIGMEGFEMGSDGVKMLKEMDSYLSEIDAYL